ncbi:phage terminase large subunit [Streptosporangium sp. NBC_01810]|uniref:phage terminase large subunit n=1 Tax=Streptosporangium sp. NBC_01810 TaxID=2975951 RepID=UPI002DDB3366|nr:phage terminase large subunit [Streptosporangium sp. NBC_01810]WSA27428.1 phage terminase large subunit [Streptosporangium sp. NBC_01810]
MATDLDPAHRQTAALDLIDRELVDLFDGDGHDRLMVFMPPQEGKSQKISRRTPAWLLSHDPTLRIAIVSYAANKAERWGRQIRRDILAHPQLGITLRADSRAAGRWETEQGGGLICVGIAGGITGEPVDVLLVDDPVEGRAEAESETYRERDWDWWESDGSTRLSSRARVVVMMTRWHEDDLAGRLRVREPGDWRVISIPAIAGPNDPLGRAPGDELASVQRRKPGYFTKLKATRSAYVFNSIFQQSPTAAEGNLFKRPDFRYWHQMPSDSSRHGRMSGARLDLGGRILMLDDCWRFITVDLAASKKTSADWTVASAWAISPDGDLVLLGRERGRLEEAEHWDHVRPLQQRWAVDTVFVEQSFISTTLAIDATAAGIPVEPVTADTDKITRAIPATHRVKQHRVWFPAGVDWLDEWCDELASFPSAAHDDQVDTLSYAARVASAHWLPDPDPTRPTPSADQTAEQAYAAATGHHGGADYLTMPY